MNPPDSPRRIPGVTLSSTFTDLVEHRQAAIRALRANELAEVAMENDGAKPIDAIDSSLGMVRKGFAYVLIIGKRYGKIVPCTTRNPRDLSITELEFEEALRLGRPILLFLMGQRHLVEESEPDADKQTKLKAFRERAKRIAEGSAVHRVYAEFVSLEDFVEKVGHSIPHLSKVLERLSDESPADARAAVEDDDKIPSPPEFYAEPEYLGSHDFVGRKSQLATLSDWARPSDRNPILLFEAIGGNGKSMLNWEWTTNHSEGIRDWKGRIWYSFYEKGSVLSDFCQRALAYMTGRPLKEFRPKKTQELGKLLLQQLRARPWLVVLDGLERILVAYQRIDAAEVDDEEVGRATDRIVPKDPCAAIRDEDDDLLRALAAASPSKILVSSRLVPKALLNRSGVPLPGVRSLSLPGLDPADAEALLRSCEVEGDSRSIRRYLKENCDCHPLTIGILAGLVNDYFPNRGNFDAWAVDPAEGGRLNLGDLDLVQKRNHILKAGLDALPAESRQLLNTLALLSEAIDYSTLAAFNPHLPPEPEEVPKPEPPETSYRWERAPQEHREFLRDRYSEQIEKRKEYEEALARWQRSPETQRAPQRLKETVSDLELRGLLQYDTRSKRFDLHPVVRGVAAGRLKAEEKDRYGTQVVDYFSSRPHPPYDDAETLDDLREGLQIMRTLMKMGEYDRAADVYRGELSDALYYNVGDHEVALTLLRPFFPKGWHGSPRDVRGKDYLVNDVAIAMRRLGCLEEAVELYAKSIQISLGEEGIWQILPMLSNISNCLADLDQLAASDRVRSLADEIVVRDGSDQAKFLVDLWHFEFASLTGQWLDAEAVWPRIEANRRDWSRSAYRPGDAEIRYSRHRLWRSDLKEGDLEVAHRLATAGKNRKGVIAIHVLRGEWLIERGEWEPAAESLHEAVRLVRESAIADPETEALLALAKAHSGKLADPASVAEELERAKRPPHRWLAELRLLIGDTARARQHALDAYRWAWADGEPYVRRYDLTKAKELLDRLGVPVPSLPPYDPAKAKPYPWEAEVRAYLRKLDEK